MVNSYIRLFNLPFSGESFSLAMLVQVAKNLKDLPSPTLAIVAERLKLTNVHEGALQNLSLQCSCFLCER